MTDIGYGRAIVRAARIREANTDLLSIADQTRNAGWWEQADVLDNYLAKVQAEGTTQEVRKALIDLATELDLSYKIPDEWAADGSIKDDK